MPHHAAPDKAPAVRLRMLREAGELRIPFTTGILVGIGETLAERVESLLAIRELHAVHGHIQEVIVQPFRAKPETRMAEATEPEEREHLHAVALARLLLPPEVSVQIPPNLSPGALRAAIRAGINDFGGISPVTRDYINPEAPWPHVERLGELCAGEGFTLRERLAVYPRYVDRPGFLAERLRLRVQALQGGRA
jgi:FO synthase